MTYYDGAAIVLSCNCIPTIDNAIEREAIDVRMYECLLSERHSENERFPFTAEQMADWLLRAYEDGTLARDSRDDAITDLVYTRDTYPIIS
jgi:hypothetical protein